MKISKYSGFFCAGVATLALLSGCGGGSSSSTTGIPSSATIFFAHSAVVKDGKVMTSGYNGFGQLGSGNLSTRANFAAVTIPETIDVVAPGANHTLALAFNNISSVYAWGSNVSGQIGTGTIDKPLTTGGSDSYSTAPVRVTFPDKVTAISAGAIHSLAILRGGTADVPAGTVYAWGDNSYGQLGDGTGTSRAQRRPVAVDIVVDPVTFVAQITPLAGVTQIASGGAFSLALKGGEVWAWGDNRVGQLGNNLAPAGLKASKVAGLTNIVQIAAAGSTAYALDANGAIWAWGYNGDGELGRDPIALPYSITPVQITGIVGTITKISAGLDHLLVLVDGGINGTVWAVGFNEFSQLGDNTNITKFTPVQVKGPAAVGFLTGVTDINAFGQQSLALVGGIWYGWGDNRFGQLGRPIATNAVGYISVPVPAQGF
jgi:alpha-tubulin suppressor-like RCC1 family protein